MTEYDYDLFVIGAGSGGVRAGRLAAQLGKRVGVAEESLPGGTCVVRGCVPKKYLVYGADFGEAIEKSKGYGWSMDNVAFDWGMLRDAVQTEVSRLSGIYSTILEKNGADLFRERAEFVDAHTVRLCQSGDTKTAKHILIAVGGSPWSPNIKGIEHAIVSDDVFLMPKKPKRMLIIGGGYIACEFAGVFAGLGTEVIQAYRGGRLLNGFDADVRNEVGDLQIRNGVDTRFNISPTEIRKTDGGATVPVTYSGVLPDLFEENQGMVGTGRYINGTFEATEILAKHDENYMPKEVVDALKEQGVYVAPEG